MVHHTIKIPLYNREVVLIIGQNAKEASEYINNFFTPILPIEEESPDYKGFAWFGEAIQEAFKKPRTTFFIYLNQDNLTNTTVEHEVIHTTWDILNFIGVRVTPTNHEAFTYLFEFILREVRKILGLEVIQIIPTS